MAPKTSPAVAGVPTAAKVSGRISVLAGCRRPRCGMEGAPYPLATQTATLASVYIYASGQEALPIGGFTGTIPSATGRMTKFTLLVELDDLTTIGSPPPGSVVIGGCCPATTGRSALSHSPLPGQCLT